MGTKAKKDWPIAERNTQWDGGGAHNRILKWATDTKGNVDWGKYASCHFWFDSSAPDPDKDGLPDRVGDYKLLFCDVHGTTVKAVPKGIFAVAAALQGSRGGVDMPADDVPKVKLVVEAYYNRMAKQFNDDSIVAPWNQKSKTFRRRIEIQDLRASMGSGTGDDNPANIISGHAVVYGQTTNIGNMFNEVIAPGALDNTDLSDVLFFVNHESDQIPLARSRRNNKNSTLRLTVDDQGLYFEATLDTEHNDLARSLFSAVSRGDISGMSFGFRVKDDEWTGLDTNMPTRTINAISRIGEISAVNSPAYPGTDINASARDRQTWEADWLAVETARSSVAPEAVDTARSSVETDKDELQLLKEKLKLR